MIEILKLDFIANQRRFQIPRTAALCPGFLKRIRGRNLGLREFLLKLFQLHLKGDAIGGKPTAILEGRFQIGLARNQLIVGLAQFTTQAVDLKLELRICGRQLSDNIGGRDWSLCLWGIVRLWFQRNPVALP